MVLERENVDLRANVQQTSPRATKRINKSGDIVIKDSSNFKAVMNSKLSDASFSNV
jgi:hypothetical protein